MGDFCTKTAGLLQYIGYALTILKIFIPLIIIALGIKDLGMAVVASKEDETKTAAKRLLWRFVAGIAIFFLPNIVLWLFGTINSYKNDASTFAVCEQCILYPFGADCSSAASN